MLFVWFIETFVIHEVFVLIFSLLLRLLLFLLLLLRWLMVAVVPFPFPFHCFWWVCVCVSVQFHLVLFSFHCIQFHTVPLTLSIFVCILYFVTFPFNSPPLPSIHLRFRFSLNFIMRIYGGIKVIFVVLVCPHRLSFTQYCTSAILCDLLLRECIFILVQLISLNKPTLLFLLQKNSKNKAKQNKRLILRTWVWPNLSELETETVKERN